MKIMYSIFILLNILTLSAQNIQAGFFCDNYLTKVTVISSLYLQSGISNQWKLSIREVYRKIKIQWKNKYYYWHFI